MNLPLAVISLVCGLALLWRYADLLVTGAVGLARQYGVSPLIIGLTVVAMGTSAPEVAASVAAVLRETGGGDIAVGNVYGSNIANLALVGGLAAIIRPIRIRRITLGREIPMMLLAACLLWPVLRHHSDVSRPEAVMLLGVFVVLLLVTVYAARKEAMNVSGEAAGVKPDTRYQIRYTKKNVFFVAAGLAGLALGAHLAVEGAVFIGEQVGLSEAVIGLTIIAIGTSLPELATCVVAAIKGHHDISVGNLVGSNIFNTLLVVGTAGVVRPFTVGQRLIWTDYLIMLVVTGGFAAIARVGKPIVGRAGGISLLCGYVAYMIYVLVYTRGV